MTVLAVATSSPQGSLALATSEGGLLRLKGHAVWEKQAMHSELATVMLKQVLRDAGARLADLTHIAVVNGPGSFTGIRVGINLARTLAYGLSLPAVTFSSLSVLSFKSLRDNECGLVAIKAIQNHYYAAAFAKQAGGHMREILAPCSLSRAELDAHATPNSKCLIQGETPGFSSQASAVDVVEWITHVPPPFHSWRELAPLYVRASEPEEKLRRGLLKPI